jgi:methionyl-tRNA formyltransferase
VRIVFMGSPEFALPALRRLIESEHEVVAAVCQPDRPAGRGRALRPPPVKELAQSKRIRVLQPERVNARESLDALRGLAPDAIVIAAFGQILKQPLLDLPERGVLNVHASLLSRHRGASPVTAAILAGDAQTGVTIMEVELALDSGPIVSQRAIPIELEDTTGTLTVKLTEVGAELLIETLPAWERGEITPERQDDSLSSYAPPLTRADAAIDWSLPAVDVWRRVRAYNPWPVATAPIAGEPLRILEASPIEEEAGVDPGTVVPVPDGVAVPPGAGFAVQCGRGLLAVVRAQRAGRRAVSGDELLRGWRDPLKKKLGT